MTEINCEFCDNEARFVCVKCKKDVCKDHADYERNQEGAGEWVCSECHNSTIKTSIILAIVFFVIVIIVTIVLLNKFDVLGGMFP